MCQRVFDQPFETGQLAREGCKQQTPTNAFPLYPGFHALGQPGCLALRAFDVAASLVNVFLQSGLREQGTHSELPKLLGKEGLSATL